MSREYMRCPYMLIDNIYCKCIKTRHIYTICRVKVNLYKKYLLYAKTKQEFVYAFSGTASCSFSIDFWMSKISFSIWRLF